MLHAISYIGQAPPYPIVGHKPMTYMYLLAFCKHQTEPFCNKCKKLIFFNLLKITTHSEFQATLQEHVDNKMPKTERSILF